MKWKAWGRIRLGEFQVAVVIVVCLILFGVYNASQFSRPQKPVVKTIQSRWHGLPDYVQDPDAGARMVEQLCRKANGDISKLSEEELKYLNAISAGNGVNMVVMKAKEYEQERQKAQQHSKEKPAATSRPSGKGKEEPRP